MEPGVFLAAVLSGVEVDRLSGYDLMVVLRACQRLVSHFQARAYETMVAVLGRVADLDGDVPPGELAEVYELASAEIRTALSLTRKAADAELGMAEDLKTRLPRVWEALLAGEIDLRRAKTIVYGVSHLPPEAARRVVDEIIDDAPGLTSGQIHARLRRLCVQADPEEAARRYEAAVTDRRLVTEATEEGTANLLGLDLPPARVVAVSRRIDRIAKSLKTSGETRSMDQLRADVLLDLLSGSGTEAGAGGGMVDIRVGLATLAELDEEPGELAGFGPVVADIARQVAAEQTRAEWRFTTTDPETGRIITGTTRRRPSLSQRRAVQSRDQVCVFPGCRMPATECDLDHRTPWSESHATHEDGLQPLCRHDHRLRHSGWQITRRADGSYRWTSPLGHTYTTRPEPP